MLIGFQQRAISIEPYQLRVWHGTSVYTVSCKGPIHFTSEDVIQGPIRSTSKKHCKDIFKAKSPGDAILPD